MNKYVTGVILIGVFFILACNPSRRSVISKKRTFIPVDSVDSMLRKNYFDYQWFSAKAKVVILNDEGKTDFAANIRAKRDSVIWISITPGLGIEVARILMTKDSVKVIDRLHKKYYAKDYSSFQNYTSIPVTLNTMENIIAGIPIYFDNKKIRQMRKDTMMMLTSSEKKIKNTLYLNSDYTIWRMDVIDSVMGKSLNLKYKEYNRDNIKPFALERELELNDSAKTNIFINFSKVKINEPLRFPFKEKYD